MNLAYGTQSTSAISDLGPAPGSTIFASRAVRDVVLVPLLIVLASLGFLSHLRGEQTS